MAEKDKAFIELAMERWKLAEEAEAETRKASLDDLKFSTGGENQWYAEIVSQRRLEGRPCLTMNRTQQMIRQVVNEYRQQRPAIHVNPVGDGADVETAEIMEGLIRHVEVNSEAEVAYDDAFEAMVRCGFSYWRLYTQMVNDGTREQEIKIGRIRNSFNVYMDPACSEPDCSDAQWAFVVRDFRHKEYKARYSESAAASLADFTSEGDNPPAWMNETFIRVAEYYYVDGADDKGRPIIRWALINCIEVLKRTDWKGRYIPLVRVVGDDLEIDGKRYLAGLVRQMKDPQRQYNYMRSAAVEAVALAPKAPWVAAKGQLENLEEEWKQSNRKNVAVLQYNQVDIAGKPAPPPQRNVAEPPIQAMAIMCQMADNDLMAAAGVNIERLGGDQGSEKSGRAIIARQQQSQVSTANFSDNMARARRYCARQLIDLFPHIYDVTRIQRIIKPDATVDRVVIYKGQEAKGQAEELKMQNAIGKIFDVSAGRYDVTVSIGPSFQTRRQEAAAMLIEFGKAYPQIAPFIADLVARNSDWPGAQEIADRLLKMLPPELQDNDQSTPEARLRKSQGQVQQLSQLVDGLTRQVNELSEEIRTKRIETASKEAIASMQEQTKLVVAQINAGMEQAKLQIQRQMAENELMHKSAHERAMQASQPPPEPQPTGAPQ